MASLANQDTSKTEDNHQLPSPSHKYHTITIVFDDPGSLLATTTWQSDQLYTTTNSSATFLLSNSDCIEQNVEAQLLRRRRRRYFQVFCRSL